MNSLSYLSRRIDVLATSGSLTPPSTPIQGSHLSTSGRPPRAKSYSRIPPRRPSHQGQSPPGQQSSSPHDGPSYSGGHTSKRSISSPALWSFRKPTTLTPNSSVPPTPAPAIQRTTSYDFPNPPTVSPHVDPPAPADVDPPSESSNTTTRPLLLRIFAAFWEVMYALWLRASGYLVVPSLFIPRREEQTLGKAAEEVDTSADEKEESEDDGIVTRARKRSLPDPHQPTDVDALSASFQAFQVSTKSVIAMRQQTFPPLDPPSFSLEPPSPEEVQERTETPRIDLIGTTARDRKPSNTLRRRNEPSSSLLPNPLISSLLVKSGSSPAGGISSMGIPRELQQQIMYQNQQHPPRKMQGVRMPKTLVLDLDETLIHSTSRPLRAHAGGGIFSMGGLGFGFGEKRGREAGHMVEVVLGGRCTLYHVYKRPFVDYFLRKVSSWYTLVIFTASMQEYADPVIDWLDAGRGILSRRMFRESCTQLPNGSYTKDLSLIEQDLSRVCLIDNSPVSYNVNPANGIPIEGWISDPSDEALLHLLPVLDSLRFATDVRRILGIRLFN